MTATVFKRQARIVAFIAYVLLNFIASPTFAACTTPAGNEGDINYVTNLHVMVYCNGTSWIGMGVSQPVSFGTLTTNDFCTATSGTAISCTTQFVNLASQVTGTLPTTNGGTGLATYNAGDILYGSSANTLAALPIGTAGYVLTVGTSGVPAWTASATNSVSSFSGGTTGLTPATATTGAVTLAGTLGVGNGGTGTATALTKGSVVFAGTSGIYTQDNANFFYDATNHRLGLGTATPTQGLTVFGNIDAGSTNGYLTEIANAGTTGTTANKLAKLNTSGAAIIAATADIDGMLGIVVGGAGTSGNAQIATSGQASCVFDGQTVPGDYVSISATVAGDCLDGGTSRPLTNQTIGRVLTANSGVGTTATVAIGLSGSGQGGVPTGTIMAFAGTCPTGWTEYTAARGRFLRGIDNGAGNDPDGTRAPGAIQVDMFASHTHAGTGAGAGNFLYERGTSLGVYQNGSSGTYDVDRTNAPVAATGGPETRPKNVAVTFCQYTGGTPLNVTASGITNYVARFISTTALGTGTLYDSGSAVGLNTASPQNLLDVNGAASIGYNVTAPVNGLIIAGNVGIGTTGPGYKLEVNGIIGFTNGGSGYENFDNAVGFSTASKAITGGGGAFGTSKSLVFGVPTGNGFEFTMNGSDEMVIGTSGNVGIGTTGPATTLDVNGDVRVIGASTPTSGAGVETSYTSSVGYIIAYDRTASAVKALHLGGNGGSGIHIDTSGDLGVGTTVPDTTLSVVNAGSSASIAHFLVPNLANGNLAQIVIGKDAVTSYDQGALTYTYNSATPSLSYVSLGNTTTNSAQLNVLGNGNVGIGTASPQALLDVRTGSNRNVGIRDANGTTSQIYAVNDANSSYNPLYIDGSTLVLNGNAAGLSSGNVGIGTTAAANTLDVRSSSSPISWGNSGGVFGTLSYAGSLVTGDTGDAIFASPAGFGVAFGPNNQSTSMVINHSGNVGIGTTSPGALLSLGTALTTIKVAAYDGGSSNTYGMGVNNGQLTFGASIAATGTPQMVLTSSGSVGIGTTSPGQSLTVNGGIATLANAGGDGFLAYARSSDNFVWAPIVVQNNQSTLEGGMSYTTGGVSINVGTGLATVITFFSTGNATLTGTLTQSSDLRLKRDILPIGDALKKVVSLNGVTFYWKDKSRDPHEQIGVVAQNVEKTFPQAVTTDGKTTLKSVNYSGLVAPLIEAVKELKALFDGDHAALTALKVDNDNLRVELKSTEAANDNEAAQIKTLTARLAALEAVRK